MDKQLKRFSYKYVGRKTIEYDPTYLTQLIYTYYSTLITERFISMKAEGEFIELTYYKPLDEKTITNPIHNHIEFDDK